MTLRPSLLVAVLLLPLAKAEAGTIAVRLTGVVTTNTLAVTAVAGQPVGSTAVMTFEVDASGSPWAAAPNHGVEHVVDPATFSLEVNGAQLGMTATGQVARLLDDYAGADKLQLNLGGLEAGLQLSNEIGLPLEAFSSTVLTEQLGVFDAAGALSYHWSVNGNGVLFVQFQTLELLPGAIGTSTCHGDGSAGVCPCGNLGAPGAGCQNSTGSGASLQASGVSSSSSGSLEFVASGLPAGVPALLVMGQPGGAALFGDGLRCVSGAPQGLGVRFTGPSGGASWSPGPLDSMGVQPSDQRAFQVIYRDPLGPCSSGFNHSSALEVTFDA